jgi:hypothetical protein
MHEALEAAVQEQRAEGHPVKGHTPACTKYVGTGWLDVAPTSGWNCKIALYYAAVYPKISLLKVL